MSDRELVIGNMVHTMRDPAFIAGLSSTFDGTKSALQIIKNLPRQRLVDKGGDTTLEVTCNKTADLTFTWQVSSDISFPAIDITDIESLSHSDGIDIVTITDTVADGMSSFLLSRIGNRFLAKYIRCKIDYAYGGEEPFTDATCDTTNTSVTVTCDSSNKIAIGQYISGIGIPVGSKVETVSGTGEIGGVADTTPTPTGAWQASQTHGAFDATSTTGSGVITGGGKATFTVTTDSDGLPTVAIATKGSGFAVGDTIVLTDPGSTSKTATITVSHSAVTSFTITTAATETNANTKLTFYGETVTSVPCLGRLNTITEETKFLVEPNLKDRN